MAASTTPNPRAPSSHPTSIDYSSNAYWQALEAGKTEEARDIEATAYQRYLKEPKASQTD
jgi:hypothetical protein